MNSITGRFFTFALVSMTTMLLSAMYLLNLYTQQPIIACVLGMVLVFLMLVASMKFARLMSRDIKSLEIALFNITDANFTVSVPPPKLPEMRAIRERLNNSFSELRSQRRSIYQKELLLDKVIETSPMAMLLSNSTGVLIFANAAARHLFHQGKKMEGLELNKVLSQSDPGFIGAVDEARETFFSVDPSSVGQEADVTDRNYHYSLGRFSIDNQEHNLHLFKDVSREINRQEVSTWKKTIKVISHELNNSLAPISSMAHSCQLLLARGDHERLDGVLKRIEVGVMGLHDFIQRYATFARLPQPNKAAVHWASFIQSLRDHYPFEFDGNCPDWYFEADTGQLHQALVNILKNAHESGSPITSISLAVTQHAGNTVIEVTDAGGGMSSEVLGKALLPFYSTKQLGSGIGLALCREIVDAHHGHMRLVNIKLGDASLTQDQGLRVSIAIPNSV